MYAIIFIVAGTAVYALSAHFWKQRRLRTASDWPTAEGYVAFVEENRDENGSLKVTLAYTYKVADERYDGRKSFPFIRDEDAAKFEAGCRQRSVLVHYRPDKPSVSVLARRSIPT
jgi:hypothetical protein